MTRTSITFGSSGSWDTTTKTQHPLRIWRSNYLAGFAAAARDITTGNVRVTFGSFASTAFAAGYRAGIEEAGKEGKS